MKEENNLIDKVNNWIRNSVTLKFIVITFLMLFLLIPTSMIRSIIAERENLNNEAVEEVSSKWAKSQQINGPVLTIPVVYEYQNDDKTSLITRYLHILPEELDIQAIIKPEKLRRGIYEVAVYKSDLSMNGYFTFDIDFNRENLKEIRYDQS